MSLAVGIYDTCKKSVQVNGGGRLQSVKVAIGELSAVDPSLLNFAWEAVVSETPDSSASIEVEWRPARQVCPQCNQEKPRPDKDWLFNCPDCQTPLRVEGGFELDVLQITIEQDEDGSNVQ